jgi:dihydroxyacetone kinase-like protein
MMFDGQTTGRLIRAVADAVIAHADELTDLDSAIGDGDHGHNMKRGMQAVVADIENFSEMSLPEALKAAGMLLVMKVGGASGPLYGTLFMTLGKNLPEQPDRDDISAAFSAAIEAVKARGKSNTGQKTMLDVLVPVQAALADGADAMDISQAAEAARDATIDMLAQRGRASFLGERSIGHMDPGARSSQIMIAALAAVVGGGQ